MILRSIRTPLLIFLSALAWSAALRADVTSGEEAAWGHRKPTTTALGLLEGRSPLDSCFVDLEVGSQWKVGGDTPLDYHFVAASLSLRTPSHIKFSLDNGDHLVVRAQFSLFGDFFVEGPENRYLAFSAAPSLEYWWDDLDSSVFLSVGGGLGFIDSTDVPGGQGQDLTFNWFAKAGLRHKLSDTTFLSMGAMFQHLSNTGLTDPNPGLDTLGPFLGLSFSF
jgi:hypothetical protein